MKIIHPGRSAPNRHLLALLTPLLICVALVTPAIGAEIVVTTNNSELDDSQCSDRDYTGGTGVSIAEAICLANTNGTESDTITFAPGISTITLTQFIPTLTATAIINGDGAQNTIIQADALPGVANRRIFAVESGGNLTLNDLTLRNGHCGGSCSATYIGSDQQGGAVLSRGFLTVNNCIFSDNSTLTNGGAIHATYSVTVTNSTFSNNSVSSYGGGGAISMGGGTLTNNTFFANSAENGNGGAILNAGTSNLTNNTLSGNYSTIGNGGGIYNFGTLNFTNTIIANSPSGGDCYNLGGSTIGTNNSNLIEDNTCSPALSGDPNLGPLADNGGPTPTMELLQAPTISPAMDAGDNGACPATDQRGEPRPKGKGCDIGAYEATYVPLEKEFFITTWKTDNPGTSEDHQVIIPIVGGPYDLDADNDGTADYFGFNGALTITFGAAGTYTLGIYGQHDSIRFADGGDKEKILSIDQWGTHTWTSMNSAFYGATNLQVLATDTPDFSAVADMESIFDGATLANPDTSGWDTSAVTNMQYMFWNAASATPDTNNWDTSNVTSMRGMFSGASLADPDTSNWDTSEVLDMSGMFTNAASANPDTSGWNTAKVTEMIVMFGGAIAADPDTSNWDTSKVTSMASMFKNASSANPDTENWDVTSLLDATEMFMGVTLPTGSYERLLINWGAQVLQPGVVFHGGDSKYCTSFAVAAHTSMETTDSWDITDGGALCSPGDDFVTTWKTDLDNADNPTAIILPVFGSAYEIDWGDGAGFSETSTGAFFPSHDYGVAGTYTIRIRGVYDSIRFGQYQVLVEDPKILSVDQWGSNRWRTMVAAFYNAWALEIPASDTPDFSSVTSMQRMFGGTYSANPDTSNWDTSSVLDMSYMFTSARSANPDTSNWDTSSVTDMSGMFSLTDLADPDTGHWDTSSVSDMSYMFSGARSANPDTGSWNTSSVTDMSHMFERTSLADPDTSNWDTSKVEDMSRMFSYARAPSPDTGAWDLTSLTAAENMFGGTALSTADYDRLLIDWDAKTLNPAVEFGAGPSLYCSAAAVAARASMVNSDGWDISDGGNLCARQVGFTVTGIHEPLWYQESALLLRLNGGPVFRVFVNGTYFFSNQVEDNSDYEVVIARQPQDPDPPNEPTHFCIVTNGSGTLTDADVTNVEVSCQMLGPIFSDGFEQRQ